MIGFSLLFANLPFAGIFTAWQVVAMKK